MWLPKQKASQLMFDNLHHVGQPIQAADPLSSGSSRLKSRLRAGLPAPLGFKNLKGQDTSAKVK
jgi:hypothetical protein